MNKPAKLRIIVAVLLLAAVCFAGTAAADDPQVTECNGQPCADNCLIIRCDLSSAEGQAVAAEVKPYVLEDFSEYTSGQMLIMTPEGMSVADAVLYYGSLQGVIYAEPDYIFQFIDDVASDADVGNELLLTSSAGDEVTNDPLFNQEWGLRMMNVPAAWESGTRGSKDVVVAVIDTGVNYNHEDLKDNIWINTDDPVNGIDDDNNGYVDDYYGYDFVNNTPYPLDEEGHGTHVAGIIGAVGNNGLGVSGVTQNVRLMVLKAVGSNGVHPDNELKAMYYAVDNGADIMNLSFGDHASKSKAVMDAICYAESKGVFLVCGSGNNSVNIDSYPFYSASYPSDALISVAALDHTGSLASYSNYGKYSVDVAAPGGASPKDTNGILSAGYSSNDSYIYDVGTSMATPMVSGLAALLLSNNPELTPVELKCIIMGSVTTDENLTDKVVTGGKVNARNALDNIATPYRLVTFVDGYGNKAGSQVIISGDTVNKPVDPVHYFKIFDGWYTEADGGIAWNFNNPVTENMTLYAHWIADTSKEIDTSWYYGHEDDTVYTLTTAAQLRGLSKIIYEDFPEFLKTDEQTWAFNGKTIELGNDIDLGGENWVPIAVGSEKAFFGNFDGNGHTVSNFSVNYPNEVCVGFIGYSVGSITNLKLSENTVAGYMFVGGVAGKWERIVNSVSVSNVSVSVKNLSGASSVGGIVGDCQGKVSDCSVIVQNISGTNTGGALGVLHVTGLGVNSDGAELENTVKNLFVSVNGDAVGGAIGEITTGYGSTVYSATFENILVTGSIINRSSEKNVSGGIAGYIMQPNYLSETVDPINVSIKNCVSLLKEIDNSKGSGRIFSGVNLGFNINPTFESCYGWEGTVDYQGELFDSSDVKNGENVATSDVWNNQSFFETLGWDFTDTWKMNAGNSNFKLPVLQNTLGTGILDASYLVHRTAGFSLPSLLEMKDGAYMIDFEKDAGAKVVETTPVTETAAKSPFPVFGILAGLGIVGLVALRRH